MLAHLFFWSTPIHFFIGICMHACSHLHFSTLSLPLPLSHLPLSLSLFYLPPRTQHEQPVLEVRMKEGYGARWYIDTPITFRGFLEPQMEGGHEKRWRH
mmetsp:Transcript_50451/g.129996  ORF Transcript_50451/g.129996 Transcript_50451/m.129996 type:complete len:99 (+) Transcript_50451:481-777(+)